MINATLIAALVLCWSANTEPGLSHYRVRFAERHIVQWYACPTEDDPAAICPEYSPFAWAWHVVYQPRFDSPPCAETAGDVCYYQHPTALDYAGNESAQPMLLWPPPEQGACI